MGRIKDAKHKYIPGDHWVTCARTGKVIRVSEARKEWNGAWVHKSEWEPKHPALILRSTPPDRQRARQPVRTETGVPTCALFWEADVFQLDVMQPCAES